MERRGRMRSVETGAEAARVPPHDLDAERAVIGAMLVSETAVAAVAERLAADDFYSEVHRIIYGAMMRLYSRGDPIDQLTLTNELRSVNEFDRVGGRPYVFQIVESVPTAANAGRYAEIVRGKALLRAVIDVGSRITEDAFREPEDVSHALDSAEQLIYGVSNRTLREHLAPVSELAPGALEMIQRLYEQEGEVTGVETGFEDLDRLTTGFHKSDLIILAARPAMGKTALSLNAIWHASGEKKMPVAIFSLEMSKEQLVQRLISQTTRIPTQALRSGALELSNEEIARYSRHLIMPEVALEGQKQLKAAKVLTVGTGGLGSPLALYLAAAGVGTIGIVDFDVVDESNLQRQIIHGTSDVGRPKVQSAYEKIKDINP